MSVLSVPVQKTERKTAPWVWVAIVFFLVVSAIASPMMSLFQGATHLNSNVVVLTQFSTAIGALATWLVWRKRLPFPAIRIDGWVQPLATAVLLAAIVGTILLIAEVLESHVWPVLNPSTLGAPLLLVIAAVITGALFGVGHFYVISAGLGIYALFVVSALWTANAAIATRLAGLGYVLVTRARAARSVSPDAEPPH
jgi:hypothetical protein